MANSEHEVRRIRVARGISQGELARRAGISRQALGAIESGTYQPGVEVALAIARELGEAVERLFDSPEPQRLGASWADETKPRSGQHVVLGRVGGRLVAFARPVVDLRLVPAAGRLEHVDGGRVAVAALYSREEIDGALLIAGCDPAVALLADWLSRHHAGATVVPVRRSSRDALTALLKGRVHIAGVHLRDPGSGEYNLEPVRRALGTRRARLVNFARWELGVATAPHNPAGIRGWEDLARPGLRIVNRERGAGARMALDEGLAELGVDGRRVAGYQRELRGHLEVAAAVAAGEADLGVTIRVAADAYGLGFIPLREERYDLVIPEREVGSMPVRAALEALNSRRFGRELAALCAYDTADTGQVMAHLG